MNKIILPASLIVLAIALVGFMTINQYTKKHIAAPVEFAVYKASSYDAPVYKDSKVSLRITIIAEKGTKNEILWQHIYPTCRLSDFPKIGSANTHQVKLHQLFGKQENIRVQYELIYTCKGSILQTQNSEIITPHTSDKIVRIAI